MEIELKEIATIIEGKLIGNGRIKIKGIASLEEAKEGDISFIREERYLKKLKEFKAAAYITPNNFPDIRCNQIKVKDISLALSKLIPLFCKEEAEEYFISKYAYISAEAEIKGKVCIYPYAYIGRRAFIGSKTKIYPFVYVGDNVFIGNNSIIYPSVILYDGVQIGNNVIIHSGAVIGADGFGYAKEDNKFIKIKHIGKVIIEDDVEIGANTCIDRATLGSTVIKRGTKLDNLIQIAHNCIVGENCAFAAMVGLSGSTVIGNNVMMGGQSASAGHLTIGNNVVVGGQSGITRDIEDNKEIMGTPAIDLNRWKRIMVVFEKLPELHNKIKELEKKIHELENKFM